jgi:hypothetical protein
MKQLDDIVKADKTVTVVEWEAAGSTAYVDGAGKIQLGEQPGEKPEGKRLKPLPLNSRRPKRRHLMEVIVPNPCGNAHHQVELKAGVKHGNIYRRNHP